MWLLPAFSAVSSLALRVFYRLRVAGEPAPETGPLLLVANHPNSLLDPAGVASAAGRPVRFLAKAPLFTDPQVGWLVRAAGAIPVYRRSDDPSEMQRNEDTFRAAHAALAAGDAVGIFPEGLSHSLPALAPLKTGAARIALGAAARTGGSFPIVPVGLSFREKERFRSEALLVRGAPVAWDDLAPAGEAPDAVRELTSRIEAALREVTVNLEQWEDAPLVEAAEEIYAAELPVDPDPARRIRRLGQAAEALARLRAGDRGDWLPLARDVRRHDRLLRRLGLRPHQLPSPGPGAALRWVGRQVLAFAILAPAALLGLALYAIPYGVVGALAARARRPQDIRATYKVLVGAAVYLLWTLAVAAAALAAWGPLAGALALIALPLLGFAAVRLYERWSTARAEARRFFIRVRRREQLRELRERQRELAQRIERERARLSSGSAAPA